MDNIPSLLVKLYKYISKGFVLIYCCISISISLFLMSYSVNNELLFLIIFFALIKAFSRLNNQIFNNLGLQINYALIETIILFSQIIILFYLKFNNIKNVVQIFILFQVIQIFVQTSYFYYIKPQVFKNKKDELVKKIKDEKDRLKNFSRPFIVGNLIMFIVLQGDKLLLEKFSSLNDVGVYNANFQFAWVPLTLIVSSVTLYITPNWFNLMNNNEYFKLRTSVKTILIYYLIGVLVLILIVFMTGDYFLSLLLSGYADLNLFIVLLIASALYSGSMFFENYFIALNTPNIYLKYRNFVFLFYIPLSYFLYSNYGSKVKGLALLVIASIYFMTILILYVKSSAEHWQFK